MPITIPQDAPMAARRTLGSLVPHPAAIGKIMGAHMGITAPKMHLAGGGIANAENISGNMFQPIGGDAVPNADVNFITSPGLSVGQGPPKGQAAQAQKQPDGMQQVAEGTGAANGLTSLASKGSGLWDSLMNSGDDAIISSMADSAPEDALAAFAEFAKKGGAIEKRAEGGDVDSLSNMLMRRESGETFHPSGLLNSAGPGRTDTINTNVPSGAYVVPADVTSGIGEGNSIAGSAIIDRMFSSQPHGIQARPIRRGEGAPHPPSSRPDAPPTGVQPGPTVNTAAINGAGAYAKGGDVGEKTPVVVAGGEHVISPQQIIAKFGSLKKGHAILDHWVVGMRQKIAREMLALPDPVGSKVKK